MSANILNGKEIAHDIFEEVSLKVSDLNKIGWQPMLLSIKVGENPAVDLYIRNQRMKAEQVGFVFEEKQFTEDISVNVLLAAIASFNVDPKVTGIILQRPVPENIPIKSLQKAIHPLKDVEGMHPASIGNIVYNELELGPCTAMASVELLRRTGNDLKGLEVVVIGHSEIVGKPIAFLLMAEGATVTVCHSRTKNLTDICRSADVIIAAIGIPNFVRGDMVSEGVVAIDVGINRVNAPKKKRGYMLVGDIEFESVSRKAAAITPVPGGVGPMTIAMLLSNTLYAADISRHG